MGLWGDMAPPGGDLFGGGEHLSDGLDDDVGAFEGEPLVGGSVRGYELTSGKLRHQGVEGGILHCARGLLPAGGRLRADDPHWHIRETSG